MLTRLMVVPSYVRAEGWSKIHLLWADAALTWCGLPLTGVGAIADAPAPDIEPVGERSYCADCEQLADHLQVG